MTWSKGLETVLTHCLVSVCTLVCRSAEWEQTLEVFFLLSFMLQPWSHSTQKYIMPLTGIQSALEMKCPPSYSMSIDVFCWNMPVKWKVIWKWQTGKGEIVVVEISHFKLNFTYFVSALLLGLKSKPNNFLSYEYFQCPFCLMFHNTYTKLTSLIT